MVLLKYLAATILSTALFASAVGGLVGTQDNSSSQTGSAVPSTAMYVAGAGNGGIGGILRQVTVCDLDVAINISTATTTRIIVGNASRFTRICSLDLITAGANNVALIEGTGTNCGTTTTGMAGGTTAASGWNFAANGGLTQGSGLGEIITGTISGGDVCIITSAATQLSGHVKYTNY